MGVEIPFTSFEELMVAQDSVAYPCDIWVKMPLEGTLDKPVWESSVKEWIQLHPLLGCKMVKGWSGHRWEGKPEAIAVRWIEHDIPKKNGWPVPESLTLTNGNGLIIFVAEYSEDQEPVNSIVYIQFHHAIADGLGIIQAIHDLWLIYDSKKNGNSRSIPERSIDDLSNRNRFGLTWNKIVRMVPRQVVGLAGVRQYLMRRPSPLVPHSPPKSAPQQVTTLGIPISEEDMLRLKRVAQSRQVSVNDCLASYLFSGVTRFRESKKYQLDSDWLRMMVPVNMRTPLDWKSLSACNVVSAIFLDRTPIQIRDMSMLLKSVHDEMELIKTNKLAFMFLLSVWIRKKMLWGRHGPKIIERCETSFVFSNLGKVFSKSPLRSANQELTAGGVRIQDFEILAPLNPFMIAAFTFVQYAKRACITLRYDERILSLQDAEELMNCLRETIEIELGRDVTN
jgi:NRPS condensation-like uncharacterized protein